MLKSAQDSYNSGEPRPQRNKFPTTSRSRSEEVVPRSWSTRGRRLPCELRANPGVATGGLYPERKGRAKVEISSQTLVGTSVGCSATPLPLCLSAPLTLPEQPHSDRGDDDVGGARTQGNSGGRWQNDKYQIHRKSSFSISLRSLATDSDSLPPLASRLSSSS